MRLLILLLLSFAGEVHADMLVPAKIEDVSPREELRKKLFTQSLSTRSCKIVSKNPSGSVTDDPSMTHALQKLIDSINKASDTDLLLLFHPQLKVKPPQVKAALSSISRIAGDGLQASLFRAYAINNPDCDPQPTNCVEDGLVIRPLYGHRLQLAVWIQVQGSQEVSRIYADLVPSKNKWLIGAWNVQQWTHTGKDFAEWRSQAEKMALNKQPISAWIFYDIAVKLLDGGKFLSLPVEKDIALEKSKLFDGKDLLAILSPRFTAEKLVYVSSLFSRHGAALLLRFSLDSEWSANAIREHCKAKFKNLLAETWAKDLAGIRCDYVLPNEPITKEGALGGIFIDQNSLKAK